MTVDAASSDAAPRELTNAQRRIWRSFLSVTAVFALVNGVLTSYAFLYIKYKLESAGGASGSILDNLLFIIVASMLFEFFAEPITGDWADAYGRRRVIAGSFVGVGVAALVYWAISAEALAGFARPTELRVIVMMALVAELCFAIAAALFNGALDAWFVDELGIAGGPTGAALLGYFSVQRRWFGVFMVVGGVASLWIARAVVEGGGAAARDGLWAITALPWIASAGISTVTALWVKFRITEGRQPARGDEPAHRRLWLRLRRTLSLRELRNALFITSALYTCWICFSYLLPVLLTEKRVVSEAGVFQGILKGYYWFYLAMGTSRFIGPYLSSRFRLGGDQISQFRWWGVLNCGALVAGGLAVLLRSQGADGSSGERNTILVPLALVLFWIAKVAEEAFKPVRTTYLNYLVVDSADRAFVLSMATPFGAVIVLAGIGALAVAQHFVRFLDEVWFSVPLLFVILGALSVAATGAAAWPWTRGASGASARTRSRSPRRSRTM
jgi:MFS family permease